MAAGFQQRQPIEARLFSTASDPALARIVMLAIDGMSYREMLGFETLTLVPIDKRLIEIGMLSRDEIAWLDAYHARVRDEIGPLVPDEVRPWLGAHSASS